jgi:ABC-2 type transport system ATP-binding protein
MTRRGGRVIRLEGLSKRYGDTTAVDSLDLTVSPGRVTGCLDTPTEGAALVDGRLYAAWPAPLTKVGALLDAKALHPRRTARNHLVAMAQSNGIPVSRTVFVSSHLMSEYGVAAAS